MLSFLKLLGQHYGRNRKSITGFLARKWCSLETSSYFCCSWMMLWINKWCPMICMMYFEIRFTLIDKKEMLNYLWKGGRVPVHEKLSSYVDSIVTATAHAGNSYLQTHCHIHMYLNVAECVLFCNLNDKQHVSHVLIFLVV